MWMRSDNVLLLLLLSHMSYIVTYSTSEDLNTSEKKKYQNSTRENLSDKEVTDMMMCEPLRQRSYFSDGDCETIKAVTNIVCSGRCVIKKEHKYPWVFQLITGRRFRCRAEKKVKKRVRALCASNRQIKTIKVRVVESCKCVLTKKNKKRRKCKKGGKNNQTDKKCRKRRRKNKNRKNRRKNRQRKKDKSTKLTNNDR